MLPVSGYNGQYLITDTNQIYSFKSKRFLKPYIGTTGYWVVDLSHNGKRKKHKMHRLICEAYHPNPQNKPFVNHKDLDKLNNRPDNLEWVNRNENVAHASFNGALKGSNGKCRGQNNMNTNLKDSDVNQIRDLWKNKVYNQLQLGELYCCDNTTIHLIVKRKTWRHLN